MFWTNEFEKYPMYAQNRELVLEEFCIFASYEEDNINKLVALNVIRHA